MLIKEEYKQKFWFHLLAAGGIFTFIYITFFLTLSFLTHHGEQVKIPDLRGKSMDSAIAILKDMHFDIHIDSTFEPTARPLSVLKQVPDTGSIVKTGRIVMLTVNALTALKVPMPNLVNLSYRSAEMLLKANKLFVGDTVYVPDIARGAIKEQRFKGQVIKPGELIAQGSKISLVIGNGFGNTDFDVPDVTRMTVDEALAIINQYNLIPNVYVEQTSGIIADTSTAYIIKQTPRAYTETGERNKIKMGAVIDLSIKQRPDPEDYGPLPPTKAGEGDNASQKNPDEDK